MQVDSYLQSLAVLFLPEQLFNCKPHCEAERHISFIETITRG